MEIIGGEEIKIKNPLSQEGKKILCHNFNPELYN
jgi:hypothetical protein